MGGEDLVGIQEGFERRFGYEVIQQTYGGKMWREPSGAEETSGQEQPEYGFGGARPAAEKRRVMVHSFAQMRFCDARNASAGGACATLPPSGLLTHAALLVDGEGDDAGGRLLDGAYMGERLQAAFKGLFAFAVAGGMGAAAAAGEGEWAAAEGASRTAWYRGYAVAGRWARATQAALLVFAAAVAAAWAYTGRRPLALEDEPHSIAAAMRVLAGSPALAGHVQGAEHCSRRRLPSSACPRPPSVRRRRRSWCAMSMPMSCSTASPALSGSARRSRLSTKE